ncbi:MAG: bifunctional DNA-formamidopyrimidine glycosylase/DNA-(apurinic or apyrimidinic site) lyase [Gammaproteobacteria bacterium]|nr:bifunctional DNA-formamidopyrimidine glycosylase/DNA-(apurinic or apyrimidinic site) lyase [Gammaproteobacteria bacterium]
MPELPEIETIKNGILPLVKNKTVTRVTVRNANLRWPVTPKLTTQLAAKKITNIVRRGKYLLFYFDSGALIIHLGMSGVLSIVEAKAELKKYDHVDICFTDGSCMRFNDPRRFGCVLWADDDPLQHKLLRDLGVEPLSNEFSCDLFFSLTAKSKRPIKLLLMDAKLVVGVGNIYANEALFMAGIHPATAAQQLTKFQCDKLVKAVKQVLTAAIEAGGTSFKDYRKANGKPGYFQQQLLVYGRQGEPCKACGTTLQSSRLGQRITVFCPTCQE